MLRRGGLPLLRIPVVQVDAVKRVSNPQTGTKPFGTPVGNLGRLPNRVSYIGYPPDRQVLPAL